MLEITETIAIDERELQFEFIRTSGPGGQNVNKVSSGVQLRFDVIRSATLPPDMKERLVKLAGNRVTEAGVLIIDARAYRTQEQNKADAIRRLAALAAKAAVVPKERKKIKPSGAGRAREKQHRSKIKEMRRLNVEDME